MYVSFLFVDLFSLYVSSVFFFSFLHLLLAPGPRYLLTPADLGSVNGRAGITGKADEVMDGQQPAEPGDAMRRFPSFLGFAWHVRMCHFFSCHQVKPCIMPATRVEYHAPRAIQRSLVFFCSVKLEQRGSFLNTNMEPTSPPSPRP